mmetsp:Transcript_18981/g.28433  ORF Transcript_18981/g.28433 Transcript_18981/m.28433 type:complete len:492 (+) Transcript_18981:105-1580(+)|eukprot:CAMPEP_0203676414 /NCGR_PEP_ID=MMETSP0090-20130426/24449_1 /ASSEMBLY_ACC=CAM_ASM_001088 /TAXON_ID=426623 /ORGANISM="Chaetoceros affinis, Strain CCMP159" /LENGTH=491 /DNA_ID=CAMNT_0050542953 /DNA_START=44 /DNA_END=1519 /DNA_ORIENTATION=+
MPSLILTGNACTGKTTFATLLSERAKKHKSGLIQNTIIINETSARPDKTLYECYASSKEEKLTRSALKSEFDKYVLGDQKTLVILDSMNYIKGFRYELHCISKAAGEKHGVVWLLCGEDVAKSWNKQRRKDKDGNANTSASGSSDDRKDYFYTEEMMDELMRRYEPPDQRNRWDRPLYRVDVHSTLSDVVLNHLKMQKKEHSRHSDSSGDCNSNTNTNTINGTSTTDHGDDDDDDGDDETSRTAEKILNKSVYNMHSLSDAIKDSTQSKTVTSNKKTGSSASSSSFRRTKSKSKSTPGSGFRRANTNANANTNTTKSASTCNDPNKAQIDVNEKGQQDGSVATTQVQVTKKNNTNERQVKKMEDIIDAILDSFLLDVEPLKEGQSTKLSTAAATNVLNDVDSISHDVGTALLNVQQNSSSSYIGSGSSGGKVVVPIGSGKTFSVQVNKTVSVLEVKRLRRQYVRWVKDHPPKDASQVGIAISFLSFLENNL